MNSRIINEELEANESEHGITNYGNANTQDSNYSYLLNDCGYKHTFSRNLVIFIAIFVLLVLGMAGLYIYDFVMRKRYKSVRTSHVKYWHLAWMANFSLRFLYEIFFEVFLCLLIHVSIGNPHDVHAYGFAVFLLMILCIATASLVALFCRGGPYKRPCSYQPSSL